MRIKHFAGYGSVNAKKIADKAHTLHIKVTGNHEWGIVRKDDYDLFNWLVKRFDKNQKDYLEWKKEKRPKIKIIAGYDDVNNEETCDYIFDYG